MALPPTSHETMLKAIRQFQAGDRSPQGPAPGDDWLGKANHKYVIVHEGKPYPVKEIVRLAIWIGTGSWPPRFGGGRGPAKKYAVSHGMTVKPKAEWRQSP